MNKLSDIKNRKYTGYIWMSDKKEPKILNNDEFDFSEVKVNPFIMEALLYSEDDKISLSIRHTGKYHIYEFDLKELEKKAAILEEVEYLPHRLEGVDKVLFKQLWIQEPDNNCKTDNDKQGMFVLKMKALVFTGFKPKN